jgi:hypothetical protein
MSMWEWTLRIVGHEYFVGVQSKALNTPGDNSFLSFKNDLLNTFLILLDLKKVNHMKAVLHWNKHSVSLFSL